MLYVRQSDRENHIFENIQSNDHVHTFLNEMAPHSVKNTCGVKQDEISRKKYQK